MDPNAVVLEISSDEDVDWNDYDDDHNRLNDSDEVVVLSASEKPVKNLKVKVKVKSKSDLVDLDDECVVLDEDPNAPVEVGNGDSRNGGDDDSDDIVVVSEKGQVACRDYPHSRHLCIKFPFSTTPNQSHCNQCYCYVCDSLAPCVYWGNGSASADHCHATDKDEFWIRERKNAKNGSKAVQLANQLPPANLLYTLASVAVQPQNQIPKPGLIHANHTSTNSLSPNIINPHRNNILASRNKLHPDLASQHVLRVNRPVFKRTDSVRATTTANQNPYIYGGNFGNPILQKNSQVNGMLSGSSKYLGSLQPNAANTSVPYHPQSQTYTSSTVNYSNPSFQSHVSSYPLPNPLYRQPYVVLPSSSLPQPSFSQQTYMAPDLPSYHVPLKTQVSSSPPQPAFSQQTNKVPPAQPSYPVPLKTKVSSSQPQPAFSQQTNKVPPARPSYPVPLKTKVSSSQPQPAFSQQTNKVPPAQPSYPVPLKIEVDSLLVPVSGFTQKTSQGNQSQGPIVDSGFKDNGLGLPTGQDSATLGVTMSTNESPLEAVSGSLADYRFDWMFDNQPIEPGFTDYSFDSAFIDTGPIFDFK